MPRSAPAGVGPPARATTPSGPAAPAAREGREAREAREARIERRRRDILQAAARIMARTGFHDMSMQAVADAAGMSVGLIYQYYGGKHELLLGVIVGILEDFRAEVPAAIATAGEDPWAQVAGGFRAFCAVIDRNREGTLLAYRESQTLDDDGRAAIMRLETETVDPLRAAVQRGIDEGLFRPVSAPLVAHDVKMIAHAWALKHWALAGQTTLDGYVEAQLDLIHAAVVRR